MIGAIIGDIAGSRFEFDNYRAKDFELFAADCRVTDDGIMTLAVARAIMEAERLADAAGLRGDDRLALAADMTVRWMREIGRKYQDCGYGGMFARWMFSDDPRPYGSFGNGAAMRVGPMGFAARTEEEVRKLSRAVTGVTHNHPEGLKGAEAVATAVFLARRGAGKDEIRELIERDYYPQDFTLDEIRHAYRFDGTCQGTVPQAIRAFLEAVSFEDAIRNAVSIGGDSDTVAAIAGSIAEAFYGVPDELREKALTYLDDELRAICEDWSVFVGKRS